MVPLNISGPDSIILVHPPAELAQNLLPPAKAGKYWGIQYGVSTESVRARAAVAFDAALCGVLGAHLYMLRIRNARAL